MSEQPNLMDRVERELVDAEVRRILAAMRESHGDKEDLATYAKSVISTRLQLVSAGLSPSQAPATGKADTGLPVNSPKE